VGIGFQPPLFSSDWASKAKAGGTKLLSELETGWLSIKLPQNCWRSESWGVGTEARDFISLSGQGGTSSSVEAAGLVSVVRKHQAGPKRNVMVNLALKRAAFLMCPAEDGRPHWYHGFKPKPRENRKPAGIL
jgi:hypothetical protein